MIENTIESEVVYFNSKYGSSLPTFTFDGVPLPRNDRFKCLCLGMLVEEHAVQACMAAQWMIKDVCRGPGPQE